MDVGAARSESKHVKYFVEIVLQVGPKSIVRHFDGPVITTNCRMGRWIGTAQGQIESKLPSGTGGVNGLVDPSAARIARSVTSAHFGDGIPARLVVVPAAIVVLVAEVSESKIEEPETA